MKDLYTWRDIQTVVDSYRNPPWKRATADAAGLQVSCATNATAECRAALEQLFPSFDPGTGRIALVSMPKTARYLEVEITDDIDAAPSPRIGRPLWSSHLLGGNPSESNSSTEVCALYSYKGGVGRTTIAVAMLADILEQDSKARVLIIDADFEAPGLTWMLRPPTGVHFSYVDALSIVHDSTDWETESLPLLASLVQASTIALETAGGRREFWFLPAVRTLDQLFEMPIKPEQLVRARGRAWVIGDLLYKLGVEMKLDAIIVDTRTGVTEFSSPLLLDPRLGKVLVTSCNQQSVSGTVETLRRVQKIHPNIPAPELVITFVPHDSGDLFEQVSEQLLEAVTATAAIEDEPDVDSIGIHRVDFAQELLYFETLNDFVARRLPGTSLGKKVAPDLNDRLIRKTIGAEGDSSTNIGTPISPKQVANAAEKLEFAEHNAESGLLPIPALKKVFDVPVGRLPNAVVIGSKGAGKTFAWGQLVLAKRISQFAKLLGAQPPTLDAQVFPLLAPASMGNGLQNKVSELERAIGKTQKEPISRFDLRQMLENPGKVADPIHFWLSAIAARLGRQAPQGNTVRERLNSVFADVPPLVLIIDGLEEAFQLAVAKGLSGEQANVLRSLLQDIPSVLRESAITNIGLIIFVRRDLAAAAISQNFGQFEALYKETALTWTPADALRLPIWLLQKLGWKTAQPSSLEVATASYDELRKALVPFWGEKMGGKREAFTDEWVIATLSDFNLVLQARDMIRLIRRANENQGSRPFPLAHTSIRNALPEVSREKIDELAKEIGALVPIFDRLRKETDPAKRVVPFSPEDVGLQADEVGFLQQLGLLARSTEPDKLFMPEIIRHGLGFRLANRGRARVLALYREARQRRQP